MLFVVQLTRELLFLVRQLNRHDTSKLQSAGFSFAPFSTICGVLAHSLQITSEELKPFLEDLSAYNDMPRRMTAGVHLACFVLRPKISGFEVLVRKDLRNLIPSVKVSQEKLDRWQTAFLSAFDDWEVSSLLKLWDSAQALSKYPINQRDFVIELCHSMKEMRRRIGEHLFCRARLITKPLEGPCRQRKDKTGPQAAAVIAFRFMTDIHYVHPAALPDTFLATRLFLSQQHCYPGSSDNHVFASHVRQEFSFPAQTPEASRDSDEQPQEVRSEPHSKHPSRVPTFFRSKTPMRVKSDPVLAPSNSSNMALFDRKAASDTASEKHSVPSHDRSNNVPGGVHVNNEIQIVITDATPADSCPASSGPAVEAGGYFEKPGELQAQGTQGPRTEIEAGRMVEKESMMDVLMGITLGKAAARVK